MPAFVAFASTDDLTRGHFEIQDTIELGRNFRENGNKGTGHGHGLVYWVLGGLMARMYGLRSTQVEQVFPGVAAKDLGLL